MSNYEEYKRMIEEHDRKREVPTNTCSFAPGSSILCLGSASPKLTAEHINAELPSIQAANLKSSSNALDYTLDAAFTPTLLKGLPNSKGTTPSSGMGSIA